MPAIATRRPRRMAFFLTSATLAVASFVGPGCAPGPYDLGRRALDQGDPRAAEEYFEQAIESGQRVEEARRERAAALLAAGEVEAALEDLVELAPRRPDDIRLLWLLGRAHAQAENHALAAAAYRRYEELTRDPRAREAASVRVAQLQRRLSVALADSLLEARRSGAAPEPNSVAVVAFLPPADASTADSLAAVRDANLRRALVSFVSADLAKVSRVRVIAEDMMDEIREELQVSYDNRRYFDDGSLVPQGGEQPARHLVYGYYESVADDARMGAVKHADAVTAEVSAREGDFDALMDLETDVVLDVLASMEVEPTAEERLAIGEKPTRNLDAFLAFGEGLRLRDLGRFDEATAAFARAGRIDPGFGMAKEQGTVTQAVAAGPTAVVVPPPAVSNPAAAAATQASSALGMGLAPDSGGSETATTSTTDMTTVRGSASLEVRGRADAGGR